MDFKEPEHWCQEQQGVQEHEHGTGLTWKSLSEMVTKSQSGGILRDKKGQEHRQ